MDSKKIDQENILRLNQYFGFLESQQFQKIQINSQKEIPSALESKFLKDLDEFIVATLSAILKDFDN